VTSFTVSSTEVASCGIDPVIGKDREAIAGDRRRRPFERITNVAIDVTSIRPSVATPIA
jgi:hypothetical protein